ncbi:MAG: hypothetical protein ABI551_14745, partial [Polyangiaceae bacterium]
ALEVPEVATARGARVLGEGAALLCVEPLEKAKARNANVRALITGYGTAFVSPPAEGSLISASHESLERAIASALEEAHVPPGGIDLVASGMAGYPQFDEAELQAIADTIGEDVPVLAPKALVGETLGAGGAMAMAVALGWMESGKPAPVVRGDAPSNVDTVLVTMMGFYGNASAVVMRRARV